MGKITGGATKGELAFVRTMKIVYVGKGKDAQKEKVKEISVKKANKIVAEKKKKKCEVKEVA